MIDDQGLGFIANYLGLLIFALVIAYHLGFLGADICMSPLLMLAEGGEKDGRSVNGGISVIGGGNLYSGHSVTGGKGGNLKSGKFKSGNVGANSFLLEKAWTLQLVENDRAMKKAKTTKRVVEKAIWV
ncbi:dolichyl-diphosphooligosaccharide--protein glycosyltransferase subunit 4A [Senna tora]|uniref:Dolichyl-diphosphooligosaccharide--protein glycosyltransferase subunit 4A n=1 Tax=Senna tora TaxID=362788 RepID=A0A835CH79_9FABA|nr:dolichyl-diphosphooligosaccharide--protein glycosyltransferase subunit 4A [Senna tora]